MTERGSGGLCFQLQMDGLQAHCQDAHQEAEEYEADAGEYDDCRNARTQRIDQDKD